MTQQVREVPIQADAATLADLQQAVDRMSTAQATAYAIERGLIPPSDEDGWEVLLGVEPDGTEHLLWVLVTEPDEE